MKRMIGGRGRFKKRPIAFFCAVVSICCLFVVFVTFLRLPEAPVGISSTFGSSRVMKLQKIPRPDGPDFGVFGDMMIGMLPQGLVFTVFVPSEKAFLRDLRLNQGGSLDHQNWNDTYATVSRVLGFSAVPRSLSSAALSIGQEISYDSLSGYALHIWKDEEGVIVANGARSDQVDIKKGEIIVHIMDGVLMDADFRQSVQPDDD